MPRRYDRWFAAYGPRPARFNNPGPTLMVNQVHPTMLPTTPSGGVQDIYRQAQSGIYDDGGGPKGGRFVGQGIFRQWLPE